MLQHPTDIHFFNTILELQLDQPAPCLQYPNKTHLNYLDSNLGSTKSIITNTVFGIKQVIGIGDCGFLYLMIAINVDKQISEIFQSQVEDFYQTKFIMSPLKKNQTKKFLSSLNNIIATKNIMTFKELFIQRALHSKSSSCKCMEVSKPPRYGTRKRKLNYCMAAAI